MSEFSTQPPESVYGEAAHTYLDSVIRADYGSELQDQDVQYGEGSVVDDPQVATYRTLLGMNKAVTSGEPESLKQQVYLASVQAEVAARETYKTIPYEVTASAFDGVDTMAERAGLLASTAHDIQRKVQEEVDQADEQGDTARAAEFRENRKDLQSYIRAMDEESTGQTKRIDPNVRNEWLAGQDRVEGFYDYTRPMQEVAAINRAEAKYLPDMLTRIASKRETEVMRERIGRLKIRLSPGTVVLDPEVGAEEEADTGEDRDRKRVRVAPERERPRHHDPDEVARAREQRNREAESGQRRRMHERRRER